MALTGEELASMLQALGPKEALGNLTFKELRNYCKQHDVARYDAKIDMIKMLSKAILAKFGTGTQEPSSGGSERVSVKRRPAAAATDIEPPSKQTRHSVMKRPAAAEHASGIAAGASLAPKSLAPASSAAGSSEPGCAEPMQKSLEVMTVTELRERCGDLGLIQAGKKTDLVDRIIEGSPKAVSASPLSASPLSASPLAASPLAALPLSASPRESPAAEKIDEGTPKVMSPLKAMSPLHREPAAMSLVVTSSLGKEGSRTIEFRAAVNDTTAKAAVSNSSGSSSNNNSTNSNNNNSNTTGNDAADAADLWKKAVVFEQEKPSAETTTAPAMQADAVPTEEGTPSATAQAGDVVMNACDDTTDKPSEDIATATAPAAEVEEQATQEDVEQDEEEEDEVKDGGDDEAKADTKPDAEECGEDESPTIAQQAGVGDTAAEEAEPAAEADNGMEEDTATAEEESTQV